jgi:hypothetical protein
VPGAFDFDKLSIQKFHDSSATERRPVAERFDILGFGVAAEEDAAVALADDQQYGHREQAKFMADGGQFRPSV